MNSLASALIKVFQLLSTALAYNTAASGTNTISNKFNTTDSSLNSHSTPLESTTTTTTTNSPKFDSIDSSLNSHSTPLESTTTTTTTNSPKSDSTDSSLNSHSTPLESTTTTATTNSPKSDSTDSSLNNHSTPLESTTTTTTTNSPKSDSTDSSKCQFRRMSLSVDLAQHSMHNVSQFNDFCKDTNTVPPSTKLQDDFVCVETAANGYVPMKTSCGQNWTDITIKNYCENSYPLKSSLWLNIPVNKRGITYKNIFCMFCHETNLTNSDWNLWELGFSCINQKTGHPSEMQAVTDNQSELQPYSTGFWTYTQADKASVCFLHPRIAENVNYSRCCKNGCQSQCYRNNSYVLAHSVIWPIPQNQSCEPLSSPVNFTVSLSLQKNMMPRFSDCDKIQNITDTEIICSQPTNHSWTNATKCPYNHYIDMKNSVVEYEESDETVYVKSLSKKFSKNEWFFINPTTIYLCNKGHEISDSKLMLSLLRFIMLLILTYPLLFYWLPEKSLWDKILAAFGVVLVVQIWCVAFDLSWLGEKAANIMWNYSLLGCSIWILILFFDFRVSLHKSRRVYVGTDSANKTFYWYLLVHVILLLMAVPFYNDNESPKFGRPKHENLLQTSSQTAFWGSASLFLVSFCILLETIDKLFRNHQLYSSRQHLNLSIRWILAMVLIWMIVSLSLLIRWSRWSRWFHSGMANWLLYSLHLLQAVIYIVFTYNEIKQRVKTKLNYFLHGGHSGQFHFRQLQKEDDRTPILTIKLDEKPRRTDNATFYMGELE